MKTCLLVIVLCLAVVQVGCKTVSENVASDNQGAIELNPKDAAAYHNRGIAKQKLGDNQGAIEDYTKAIELVPEYALAYNNRGLAKQKLGDKEGACQDWRRAVDLYDKDAGDLIKKYCQ